MVDVEFSLDVYSEHIELPKRISKDLGFIIGSALEIVVSEEPRDIVRLKNDDNYNIKKAIQKEGKASYGVSGYTHTINRLFKIIKTDPKNKGVLNEVCRAEKELIAFLYDEPDALTKEKIHAYWNAYMQSFIFLMSFLGNGIIM